MARTELVGFGEAGLKMKTGQKFYHNGNCGIFLWLAGWRGKRYVCGVLEAASCCFELLCLVSGRLLMSGYDRLGVSLRPEATGFSTFVLFPPAPGIPLQLFLSRFPSRTAAAVLNFLAFLAPVKRPMIPIWTEL